MSTNAQLALAPDPDADVYRQLGIDNPTLGRLLHVLFSHLIGTNRGERNAARNWLVALAGMVGVAYRRSDGSVEETTVPDAPTSQFSDGKTVLSRLGLAPNEIDRMFRLADASNGVHATLPLDIVIALFPPWAWQAAAAMIGWGPGGTAERLERFARLEALRSISPTCARPEGGTVSTGQIDRLLSNANGLMRTLVDLHDRNYPAEELGLWTAVPRVRRASELGAAPADTDRSAPPLSLVRRVLRAVHEDIQARRHTAEGRERLNRRLRLRLWIALLVVTGSRRGALSRVRVCDYDGKHRFPDGIIGPAIRLYPRKRLGWGEARWKALPEEVAEWTEETIAYFQLVGEECLWRSDSSGKGMTADALASLLTGSRRNGEPRTKPALPREDDPTVGYSPHTLRHLAEQLAFSVGHDYLEENPRQRTEITPQVLADSILDHSAIAIDRLGYKDLASTEGRERYARIAALGIWEYVWGDRGARHAPDGERIERAIASRDEVLAQQTAVEARITDLRSQRRGIEAYANGDGALPVEELMRLVLNLSRVSSALDDEYQEGAQIERHLVACERELQAAQTDLVPIPDDAPDPEPIELMVTDAVAAEQEEPVRDWLLPVEAARAFAVSEPTMRRWFRGELPHPEGDPRNPWQPSEIDGVIEKHSSRKRRLIVSRLDRSRIAPEVMRAINQMLMSPPR